MRIILDRGSHRPLYLQITDQIKRQILSGELPDGFRLPSERRLAENLGVNRITIMNAYRDLKAENLIGSRVGQGTVVLSGPADGEEKGSWQQEPVWNQYFSEYSERSSVNILNSLLSIANQPDIISFATGIISQECVPPEVLKGVEGEDAKSLLHSPVEGFYSLRQAIAGQMEKKGSYCVPEEIMLLSGSQQGIDLTARLLLNPGDLVVTEDPTFFPAIKTFKATGARVLGIPVEEDGMRTDILEQYLQRYQPKFIYTIPSFHNPTGSEMSLVKRRKLIELAHKYKVLILEDDAYGELCYEKPALPTLKSMDSSGYVIYLNTFSKTVYPGLRIGWVAAHRQFIRRLASVRQIADLHTNCLSQKLIERYLESGKMEEHITGLCVRHRKKRDVMAVALARYAPVEMSYRIPEGGYYFWCRLPEGISAERLVGRAADYRVAFLPGKSSFTDEQDDCHIRLNFTFAGEADIEAGIRRLCQAVREEMQACKTFRTETITDFNPIV